MATTAHTEEPGGHKRAFPPFQSETFASQLFWLALSFVLLYLLMAKVALPRINGIMEDRRRHIEADLAEAQRLKQDSDAAIAAYETALAQARARAQALAAETQAKAIAAAATRRKEIEAKLNARVAEAEKAVAQTRTAAMSNVLSIASEAAAAIVERLTGVTPASEEVASAVGYALER